MTDREAVIEHIHKAFDPTPYPGDAYLLGSSEGCEPAEEAAPFKGQRDWGALDAELLDSRYNALSFFSEAAFRFFLPAYLIADLLGKLKTADPLFHLTGGFHEISVRVPMRTRDFTRRTGGSVLVNPRRYGAITFGDYARYRLSVFTREEARAIVAYLHCRRDADVDGLHGAAIDAALDSFWLERAERAPSAESLERHLEEEKEYLADLSGGPERGAEYTPF